MTPNQLQKFLGRIDRVRGGGGRGFLAGGGGPGGEAYLRGLLLDGDRKSIELDGGPVAGDRSKTGRLRAGVAAVRQPEPLGRAGGPGRPGEQWVGEQFGKEGLFILDDTGFPKCGDDSVGVSRQYSGTLGKIDNRQGSGSPLCSSSPGTRWWPWTRHCTCRRRGRTTGRGA